nr:MAG TPA_asm: hypothetical protein [Caudoviricetes sp.]
MCLISSLVGHMCLTIKSLKMQREAFISIQEKDYDI